jgi:hypothetical protein
MRLRIRSAGAVRYSLFLGFLLLFGVASWVENACADESEQGLETAGLDTHRLGISPAGPVELGRD